MAKTIVLPMTVEEFLKAGPNEPKHECTTCGKEAFFEGTWQITGDAEDYQTAPGHVDLGGRIYTEKYCVTCTVMMVEAHAHLDDAEGLVFETFTLLREAG